MLEKSTVVNELEGTSKQTSVLGRVFPCDGRLYTCVAGLLPSRNEWKICFSAHVHASGTMAHPSVPSDGTKFSVLELGKTRLPSVYDSRAVRKCGAAAALFETERALSSLGGVVCFEVQYTV